LIPFAEKYVEMLVVPEAAVQLQALVPVLLTGPVLPQTGVWLAGQYVVSPM
jgi:hypothetical protein